MEISDEERMSLCAALMSAARRIGIEMGYFTNEGKHRYVWSDLAVGAIIEGPVMDDQKDALFSACVTLQQYFNERPPGKPNSSSKSGI